LNKVILALGSSTGKKLKNLSLAKDFLFELSEGGFRNSSIWETEPVGLAMNTFYNAVIELHSDLSPDELLTRIKEYEELAGRDLTAPRWSDRIIDIDIIDFNGQIHVSANLEIPHPEYKNRRFVLNPLSELYPNWTDALTGCHIDELIFKAPPIQLSKMSVKW
jgi:2-amino-4-hydroxy-6-hydroxymethyldihydropteridine diphosphokinase